MTQNLHSASTRSVIARTSLRLGAVTLALGALGQAWAASATSGQTLYNAVYPVNNTCAGCHGAVPTGAINKIDRGISAQVIKNACGVKMACPTLTDAQYNDLALYIATARGNAAAATCIGGSCVTATPAVTLSAASVSFGNGFPTKPVNRVVTLTNSGSAVLNISSVALTTGTAFSIVAGAGTTCTNGGTVAAGANCTVTVAFNPTTTGTLINDTLTFTTNANPTTNTVSVSGTGTTVDAPLSWVASTVTAPSTVVGSTSTTLTATLSNAGPGTASVTIPTLTGAGAADFTAMAGTCLTVGTLAANATCSVTTTFKPTSAGTKTAALSVTTDGQAPVTDLTFTGAATAAPVTNSNSGGGGCTIGQADQPMDPLWLLLLGGAGLALFQRRRPIAAVNR